MGEPLGGQLALWLNRQWPDGLKKKRLPSRSAVARVARLIELLQGTELPDGNMQSLQFRPYKEARRMLTRYRFRLDLTTIFEHPDPRPGAGWIQLHFRPLGPNPDEAYFIHGLLELTHYNLHRRLRRCQWCKRWLFAHFSSHKFCSQQCRKTHRERSESYKAYRREKARETYWFHKVSDHRNAQRRKR